MTSTDPILSPSSATPLVTPWQRVPAWAMVRQLARHGLTLLTLLAMLPAGALAAAVATSDLRWVLVALMLLFVVAPMALLLIYFRYALRPQVARAVLPHRLTIIPGESITVEYQPDGAASETSGSEEHKESTPRRIPSDETIPWSEVDSLICRNGVWIVIRRC